MKVTFKGKPLIPSKYIEAADLQGKRAAVVIESIKHIKLPARKADDPDESRPLFKLRGKEKGWVLNTTNLESIAEVYGWQADKWIGKTVVIYGTKVRAFGQTTLAIRVDIDATQARADYAKSKEGQAEAAKAAPAEEVEPEHDEETGEVADSDDEYLNEQQKRAAEEVGAEVTEE